MLTIEALCDRHLGGRPSAAALTQMKKVENERPEVHAFAERMFHLMEISRFDPKDISPAHAWAIGTMIPGILPGAWGGSIPPYTWKNRHRRIDAYLNANPWATFAAGTVHLEVGCGFPPQTAIDTARAHPDWHIIGADPCFDEFLLYDEQGHYACLDQDGRVRYFHAASSGHVGAFQALYGDRSATLRRFGMLFVELLPKLGGTLPGEPIIAEDRGRRLIRHPLRLYEESNLRLVQAGIGAEFARSDIVRCFNVLGYFDAQFRKDAEDWASRTLNEGGLFICGSDGPSSTEARYSVYRREMRVLVPKEFAVSIDCVRPFTVAPWFSMHDRAQEALMQARLLGLLRDDEEFRRTYNARYDTLLAEKRLFVRDGDGFLAPAPDQLPQDQWTDAQEDILLSLEREGFAERGAAVLRKLGLKAWMNCVGHVAIDPVQFGAFA
jgi:hypothetical protein